MAFIAINSVFVYIAGNNWISIPVYDSNFFLIYGVEIFVFM